MKTIELVWNPKHKPESPCVVKHGGAPTSSDCSQAFSFWRNTMGKLIDLTGQRFGMLMVLKRAPNKKEKVTWGCECDCGKTSESTTSNLLSGASKSCGCVRTKHLGRKTRLYRIWTGMKDRCLNSNSKYRARYGGRGISICKAWAADFPVFRDWALANGYKNDLTIDRIENNGNYEPANCQWLTRVDNSKKGQREQ